MNKTLHSIYIGTMMLIVIVVTIYLSYSGFNYYNAPLEERFYLDTHYWLKPSGILGQGLGVLGTFMILFGVVIYIARKRYNFLAKFIRLKYLLEFHIFLCILGPILILFHTAFKFGGIVSIAFWSMVIVVLSGVIGRFIYVQIPRTIKGRELSLGEINNMKEELNTTLLRNDRFGKDLMSLLVISEDITTIKRTPFFTKYIKDRRTIKLIKKKLRQQKVARKEIQSIIQMAKDEIKLSNKIARLQTMQKYFKYWHVAHLPFALVMLIILLVHVGVTLTFGYTWIF